MAAARLYAYLSYDDAPGALRWLEAVGFDVVRRQDGANGEVLHSEVRLGDVVLMVASNDAAYVQPPLVGRSTGQGLYLLVDEVYDVRPPCVLVTSQNKSDNAFLSQNFLERTPDVCSAS